MSQQIIPIYIPQYISSQTYAPARVLPRIFFYNGQVECETWYVADENNNGQAVTTFPYFDNYNVVTGSFPTDGSKSLLFNNEATVYGALPSASLYSTYWDTYVGLLYSPTTRLINCSAIIPLADYFKMELNDICEWRGNYYHLRAINNYNLSNGECQLQLLGPIIGDILPDILPAIKCNFSYTSEWGDIIAQFQLVAGGGGGGSFHAGGGGGGAVITGSILLDRYTSYPVTIGAGGAGGAVVLGGEPGTSGGSSSFATYAIPGGGYGGANATPNGGVGASGGGGNAVGIGGVGSLYGFAGGTGSASGGCVGCTDHNYAGGGGGGWAFTGSNAILINLPSTGAYAGGTGGNGMASILGTHYYGAGGGGGGFYNSDIGCSAGPGGNLTATGSYGGYGGGDCSPITGSRLQDAMNGASDGYGCAGGGGGFKAGIAINRCGQGGNGTGGALILKYPLPLSTYQGNVFVSGSYVYNVVTSSITLNVY